MAWRTLLALGLGSILATACTAEVKVNGNVDGGLDDGGSSGGSSNTGGGSNTGGKSGSGGSSTGGGGASTGGASGAGGSTVDSGPATCNPATAPDDCSKCAEQFCCQDYSDCQGARCAGSTASGADGELVCMIDCLTKGVSGLDGGGASRADCADKCKGTNAVLDKETDAVIACLTTPVGDGSTTQPCGVRCFGADVQ
jgi:hypothetical protein